MPSGGMCMWPPPFPWRTTTDQCWPGVLRLTQPDSIWSPRDWYARNLGKIDFPPQFVLFCHLREELASRRGSFGRFYSAKEAPKPRWDRNSYVCGIISVLFWPGILAWDQPQKIEVRRMKLSEYDRVLLLTDGIHQRYCNRGSRQKLMVNLKRYLSRQPGIGTVRLFGKFPMMDITVITDRGGISWSLAR